VILTHLLLTIFLDITHTRRCDIPYFRLHRERGVDIIRVRSYYQDLTLSDYVDRIFLYLPMHTRTHTRTQTYTRTHTRTHTHTHTHVHAHTHTNTHAYGEAREVRLPQFSDHFCKRDVRLLFRRDQNLEGVNLLLPPHA